MPTPKDRRSRLEPEVRRNQIVAAASATLRTRPVHAVTFEEIAEAAGVSRALVYNYFGDRGGLLAAVYLQTFAELDALLAEQIGREQPPRDRLRGVVSCYLRFAADHPEGWRLVHLADDVTHPAVAAARQAQVDGLAQAWGDGRGGQLVACAVLGMLEAVAVAWLHERQPGLEELTDRLADLLWTGLSGLRT